jgi:hypothetical protein
MRELAALSAHMTRAHGTSATVVGGSWLYNLEAYRRLFPPAFIATAQASPPRFRHMPLWGQFLDRHGETKDAMTRPFLDRLARLSTLDGLASCFPFQTLALQAPASVFADYYVPPLTTSV